MINCIWNSYNCSTPKNSRKTGAFGEYRDAYGSLLSSARLININVILQERVCSCGIYYWRSLISGFARRWKFNAKLMNRNLIWFCFRADFISVGATMQPRCLLVVPISLHMRVASVVVGVEIYFMEFYGTQNDKWSERASTLVIYSGCHVVLINLLCQVFSLTGFGLDSLAARRCDPKH